ncbi:tail fiber protein [Aquimarina algiphila]|uniref:tail fiber protein n=1 Tax=Aquimarina algiphila TaxID=2047982 RepID=UPI00232ED9F8|nr:tail fiber protein [Aquimarina algiphila]
MKNILFSTLLLMSTLGMAQTNTFPSSGNVGIGTTTPTSKLQVYDDVNGPVWLGVYNNSTSSASISGIKLGMGDSYDIGTNLYHKRSDNTFYFENLGQASSRFAFLTRKSDGTYGITLKIDENGDIGIGTDTPTAKVDIRNGHLYVGDETFANPDNWGQTINIDDDLHSRILIEERTTGVQTSLWSHTGGNARVGTVSDHDFGIMTKGKEKIMIKTNGDVGIGTTNPDSKLTVKGKIHAEEVKVDLSVPAPDYVFTKDYKLLTIEEVQQHIKENGHLPNVPSATEMETNGVELGVMNMKLLEKIEELTLYTINQEKKLQEQQKINKDLETRLTKIETVLMNNK